MIKLTLAESGISRVKHDDALSHANDSGVRGLAVTSIPPEPETMYLQSVRLQRFRSCGDVVVEFQPMLTLLVGENNAGKSNVIDALRLATAPLSGRRTRYFEVDDVTRHRKGPISLGTTFTRLSRFQRAQYIGAVDTTNGEATFTTRYHPPDDTRPRGRVEQLAGPASAPDSEPEKRDQINHVYLAPLRDAQRQLDSASGTRLGLIMEHLAAPEQKEQFVEQAKTDLKKLSAHPVVTTTTASIQGHMSGLTAAIREQTVAMGFEPPELNRLARSLRLKMAEHDIDPADLAASGLGFANLLYMATVVLELQNAMTSELTLFLVEEPEAHLHPQLQAVLLEYLLEQAESSGRDDADGPAGRIQVIATTHSPNLASAVRTSNVVVLRSADKEIDADAQISARETVSLPLSRLPLEAGDRRKIDQYLDVTRSELLFTQRAILVEGIAEAVLVPALARECVFPGDDQPARTKRRQFRGSSIISVGSVDFSPYLRLLLAQVDGVRLADSVVVITDRDPAVNDSATVQKPTPDDPGQAAATQPDASYNRASAIEQLGAELDAGSALYIAEAPHTLEADLLVAASNNGAVLKSAYLAQHPKSEAKWDAVADANDPADALYTALREKQPFIAKGQFAHDVAQQITEGAEFACPDYLERAIRRIVDGPADG